MDLEVGDLADMGTNEEEEGVGVVEDEEDVGDDAEGVGSVFCRFARGPVSSDEAAPDSCPVDAEITLSDSASLPKTCNAFPYAATVPTSLA